MLEIPILISKSFQPLLQNSSPYLVLIGGAGSGKSEFVGRKLLYRCLVEGGHRFLILRKVRSRVRESVLELMMRIARSSGVKWELSKSDRTLTIYAPGRKPSEILFDGLDDPDKIKSIVGLTGLWLEEATEFTREDFMQLDLRLRGETPFYKQIILSLNPDEVAGPWIKEEFCYDDEPKTGEGKKAGSYIHHSTIEDNPIRAVRDEYTDKLEALNDRTYYDIYRRGVWALARGLIYSWDVVDRPAGTFYDEIFYGLDFGYSVDPAALVRVYRKADEFWLEEIIYDKGLTNQDLAKRFKEYGLDGSSMIYADSAEPKSIEELRIAGFAVYPCEKGKDSVRTGIDYLKARKIHILRGSDNIIAERKVYKYKDDPSGEPTAEPVKFKDHAMDAIRYAIFTHVSKYSGWGISYV